MAVSSNPLKFVIVTLDRHLHAAAQRVEKRLLKELPGLELKVHAAADWEQDPQSLEQARHDILQGDVVLASMLFMEDHFRPILDVLQIRRDRADGVIGCMSAGEVVRLTRIGKLDMSQSQGGPLALLKRLRGKRGNSQEAGASSGARQMAMLRRLPRILRFIPGTAQDLRIYFLTMQYWLASSDENLQGLVQMLLNRYPPESHTNLRGKLKVSEPVEYPDTGLYHPRLKKRITDNPAELPKHAGKSVGRVGVLVMRSYVLAGDTAHYDAVIGALEARGLEVVTAFASGLDARPAVEAYFLNEGQPRIDALLSLTGFSLVGGPAYNDASAAEELLKQLDVPYLAAQPLEFQSLQQWEHSERGLMPVEATMMVAIPELDGATGPIVFGGRGSDGAAMQAHAERTNMLAARVARLVQLRRRPIRQRKLAISLFCFPPNAGNIGTAAHIAVWESLLNTLRALQQQGYDVDCPNTVDELRRAILEGNATQYGTHANVHTLISADDHVRREPHLKDIEAAWGPAPGRQLSNGRDIFVLGAQFGQIFVGIQPAFGYEGDPMRLLFEKGFAPTHAFSAYHRYIHDDFAADAVLHFGTHGALEFMPGKQAGLTAQCWPDRLIGDLPNFYLYAANNPSEGLIAKRRSAATLVSYLTPPMAQAGLYKGLVDLKESLQRWRELAPNDQQSRATLAPLLQASAAALDLAELEPVWDGRDDDPIEALRAQVHELERTLIPQGLHVLGETPDRQTRKEWLQALQSALSEDGSTAADIDWERLLDDPEHAADCSQVLRQTSAGLAQQSELSALLHALNGGFVPPAPAGDLLRTPELLPTGRNLHGFDPFKLPSSHAMVEGQLQAQILLDRYAADGHAHPRTIALVLWGTDNLKTEGGPIAQALALMGARPRRDSFGRLAGAELVPLAELGRPRIDVLITLSGIFRDLLPMQTQMLAEAAFLAASAEEDPAENAIREHALAYQQEHDCDLETAALRVFSNADGSYGANVNQLLDSSAWGSEDELAETYSQRKCFAYGRRGKVCKQPELLQATLSQVELTYQNLESVELGVTTINHYFDTLGGISRSVQRASGQEVPVYIGDQTSSNGTVRSLSEQVALETRTRMLNPKWHEGLLEHGYEGVRHIEEHITNTMGWSATTGQVQPWVYKQLTQTFVLDTAMRERLAKLNPTASAKLANRLIEAHERAYWQPDEETLAALREAGAELEDRVEGIGLEVHTA